MDILERPVLASLTVEQQDMIMKDFKQRIRSEKNITIPDYVTNSIRPDMDKKHINYIVRHLLTYGPRAVDNDRDLMVEIFRHPNVSKNLVTWDKVFSFRDGFRFSLRTVRKNLFETILYGNQNMTDRERGLLLRVIVKSGVNVEPLLDYSLEACSKPNKVENLEPYMTMIDAFLEHSEDVTSVLERVRKVGTLDRFLRNDGSFLFSLMCNKNTPNEVIDELFDVKTSLWMSELLSGSHKEFLDKASSTLNAPRSFALGAGEKDEFIDKYLSFLLYKHRDILPEGLPADWGFRIITGLYTDGSFPSELFRLVESHVITD